MLTVLACIFVFGILISVHEFGHFITAKLTGMRVDEFAIGFGPEIYTSTEGETQYSLRALPLGGYNKIAGMDPDDAMDDPRGFNNRPVWARMIVILAGSAMNVILPVLIFFGLFVVSGIDAPISDPVIGQVVEGYAAEKAGIQKGDRILTVDGKTVSSWTDLRQSIMDAGTKEIDITLDRDGAQKNVTLTPEIHPETGNAFIGIVSSVKRIKLGPADAAVTAVRATKNIVKGMYRSLYSMITGKTSAEIAGPVGVAKMAGQMAHKGIDVLLQFTAMLSLNLAVINLLPLPALDGGHFIILLVEALTGRKLGRTAMLNIQKAGIAMILAITIFATFKDLTR